MKLTREIERLIYMLDHGRVRQGKKQGHDVEKRTYLKLVMLDILNESRFPLTAKEVFMKVQYDERLDGFKRDLHLAKNFENGIYSLCMCIVHTTVKP